MRRGAAALAAVAALALAAAGGCRNERESVAEEVAEVERTQREVAEELGPGASPDERREARGELREAREEAADAVEELHGFRAEGGPEAGTDVIRGTVTAVTPEGVRVRTRDRGELSLGLPASAAIQASNGHELGREYVVPGAEVRAVYHGADTPAPTIDELWVERIPGQERLPTQDPMGPALPLPTPDEGPGPPTLPEGDPGGGVPGAN